MSRPWEGKRDNMEAMSGKLLDKNDQEYDLTKALAEQGIPGLTFSHFETHNEDGFISDYVTTGTSIILAFRTPDSAKEMHLFAEFASESAAHMDIIRGPNWAQGSGTRNPIYNRDQNSSNRSGALENTSGAFERNMNLVLNPNALADGTIIHDLYTWSDKKHGGIRRDDEEFILRRDWPHAIRLTSDDGVKGLQLILRWYEHER